MNSKGPSIVDLDTTERASSRRSLLGLGSIVAAGTVVALASSTSAAAAPDKPTDADRVALDAAMRLELAARDLYRQAAGELDGDAAQLASVVGENHEAYAQAISGAIGASANMRNDDVFNAQRSLFATSDVGEFAVAARTLENIAVATHTELLATYESIDAIELTASIITTESRQAVVFTSLAGLASNLDEMLSNSAAPLELSGGAA
ncbi:MAG: ferritin-like domain-containing protein [Actinomycetota bacterium]|nr:ferritin-like domain-containing protein [Actinomycetota bacterium]